MVHFTRYGAHVMACGMTFDQAKDRIPQDHWTGSWKEVTCPECRAAFSKPMRTFFTLTNVHNQTTNSRSKRYGLKEEAVTEAQRRLANKESDGVIIMQAIEMVTLAAPVLPPIIRVPLLENPDDF